MINKNYSELLKDPRWQRKRLEIMSRDNFTCIWCEDNKNTLNVHHKKYDAHEPWNCSDSNMITLCKDCHEVAHNKIDILDNGTLEVTRFIDENQAICRRYVKKLFNNDGKWFVDFSELNLWGKIYILNLLKEYISGVDYEIYDMSSPESNLFNLLK